MNDLDHGAAFRFHDRKRSRPSVIVFPNSTHWWEEMLRPLKSIGLILTAIFLFSACEWFGPAEKYKTEPGRTTYRSADENPGTGAQVMPAPQKIPGESRR